MVLVAASSGGSELEVLEKRSMPASRFREREQLRT